MYDLVFIGDMIESPALESMSIKPDSLLKCRGEIGDFSLAFMEKEDEVKEVKAGAIIINIDAEKEAPVSGVLTFEDKLDEDEVNGMENIVFIQDYQSVSPAIMSRVGLERAISTTEKHEDIQVYYFYRSMRFIEDNDSLFEKARKLGIVFLKYEEGSLEVNEAGEVSYQREDISLQLKEQVLMAPEFKPAEILSRVARILNIEMSSSGYLQVENIYLQPTMTGKRGIYVLGGSRGPTAYSDFAGEAEFTINEIRSTLSGEIKPLVDDERVVDDQKCALCYTCYRVCPHGAIEKDEELDAMKVNQLACYGCNACVSHCPAKAITIIENAEEPVKSDLKVLMCENSAATAWDKLNRSEINEFQVETIPCSSSVNKEDIYHYLHSNPENRVLILGCFEESCKHLSGDKRGEQVVSEIRETLNKLDLGEDRVIFQRLSPRMEEDLASYLSQWKDGVVL